MALLRCSLMALLLLFVVVMAGAEKAKKNCSNSSDVGAEKAPKNNSSLLAIAPVLFVSGYGFGVLPVDVAPTLYQDKGETRLFAHWGG